METPTVNDIDAAMSQAVDSLFEQIQQLPTERENISNRLLEMINQQAQPGNYDHDEYNFGFLNGMVLALSVATGEPLLSTDYFERPHNLRLEAARREYAETTAREFVAEYPHYRKLYPFPTIDIYRVLEIYNVTSAPLQHAIKKLLALGGRGSKNAVVDALEAIDAINRYLQMREENELFIGDVSDMGLTVIEETGINER